MGSQQSCTSHLYPNDALLLELPCNHCCYVTLLLLQISRADVHREDVRKAAH